MQHIAHLIASARAAQDAVAQDALAGLSAATRAAVLAAYGRNPSVFLLDVWEGRWPGLDGLNDRALLMACRAARAGGQG